MKKIMMTVALVSALGLLAGCDNEGPAERAGERMDRDAERVRDKMEDAGEKANRELDRAGDKIEDAARDSKREVKDATR
jgi:hyperosmotically inducible periplasmic protein